MEMKAVIRDAIFKTAVRLNLLFQVVGIHTWWYNTVAEEWNCKELLFIIGIHTWRYNNVGEGLNCKELLYNWQLKVLSCVDTKKHKLHTIRVGIMWGED